MFYHKNAFLQFIHAHPEIPTDCLKIVKEYIPIKIVERCYYCGDGVVYKDEHNRTFYANVLVCTETVSLCIECFELFYQ